MYISQNWIIKNYLYNFFVFSTKNFMKIIWKNKFAFKDYDIVEKFEAWVVLVGSEVKSLKQSWTDLKDCTLKFLWSEIFANFSIKPYDKAYVWTSLKQSKKLLLTKKQLSKLFERTTKTWLTLVPIEIFINSKWYIKFSLWLWKIFKKIDKKPILKEKALQKEALRDIKSLVW